MKLLEKEGMVREEIIDLKLYDLSLKRFKEIEKKDIFNDPFFIAEPNCMIDNLVLIRVLKKEYYLLFADNCQVRFINCLLSHRSYYWTIS